VAGFAHHQVGDAHAAERLTGRERPHLARRRPEEKPAEEGEPDAPERAQKDELGKPAGNEEVGEAAGDAAGGPGRGRQISRSRPERRTEHTPAVERQRRDHVEQEQKEVDEPEPRGDAVHRARKIEQPGGEHEQDPDRERDERAGDRDPELRPRAREHALEARDPAEEPEGDSVDLDALAPSLERVPQLVQQERGEEERRRDDGHGEVRRVGEAGVLVREDGVGERPGDEHEDDEPAPVDPDPDPRDPADREALTH
jgi:hypothetical protein